MATNSSDQIRMLFEEHRNGTLSDPAAQQLKQLLDNDPLARDTWDALQQQAVRETAPNRPPRRLAGQWFAWAATALLLMVAAGSYFIYHTHRHHDGTFPARTREFVPVKNAVQLLVPGRASLALTGDSSFQIWQVGQVQLRNDSTGLHYGGPAKGYGLNTLLVPPGADYRITLSDGTQIWLNCASKLRFPFSFPDNKREVYLEGEAWFIVAANPDQPFEVHTPNTSITVLGTAFNVNGYDDERVRVSLVEGALTVKGASDEVTLKPGMECVYGDYNGIRTAPFDTATIRGWMKGEGYAISNQKLRDLKPILERWFAVQVIFDKPEIAHVAVTGPLEKNKLPAFLQAVEASGHLRYYFMGNELHFTLP
ncbi:FecR domain-containing protein [Chitinophaga oryzae]|uniref:FecR domain-containing protein n=1 Tax=Chitinophaga oryzae TaxID=2725414 RepID=A0AAE6ZKQ6_9BACT|nr:FecR domain-containing protein [Chitinophaga oryzae]QJB33199.1 FecR domain-containing protein [Chitinophaga oryzae]QJB39675.1 FecR domain-containing protein [Chitinophaga oryzae]